MKSNFDEIELVNKFLNYKGGVMFDVGSLDGSSFMPFLLREWEIYSFEADKNNYVKISNYLNKWGLKAHLEEKAVSDIEETKTFYTSTSSRGIPSLLKFDDHQVVSHEVKTITLKGFIKSKKITRIDFLKIDIEGYDFMALKGFDFSILRPRVIMCEFEDKKTKLLDYSTVDMAKFLESKGYSLVYSIWYPIKEYGTQHNWRKISTKLNEVNSNEWGNIIAFSDDKDFKEFLNKNGL